ncbi:MAG: alkaline shock response membrane anchor protein AmaP [Clostridiaceae bacterium]|nr:alkaline shock response membrane anchor protein AmaP [Oscillospiraceae bacterium]NLO62682.1 alkaline shock response membrane anchor protein AmaP [Clostridiaceae bacterium]
MNQITRTVLIVYSFLLGLISLVMLYALFDTTFFGLILSPLTTVVTDPVNKFIYLAIMLVIFASCVVTATFSILSGRLSHTRIRQTDIGSVDIGVDAMESIVLNSAKSAQVGIKSAKAHVSSAKNGAVRVRMSTVLYSNVEIPAMMAKVQERIKKDIEKYTGITVESVAVKVSRVEPVVAKVER